MKDKDWILVTNFEEKDLTEIAMALEGTKVSFKITTEAYDTYGRLIPDAHGLYFTKDDAGKAGEEKFWEYIALIKKHKNRLIAKA